MTVRPWWLLTAVLAGSLTGETVRACHVCKQTPCVYAPAPAPAFECVTEMVPCTVMKTKTRVDLVPTCTKTVMKTKFEIVYEEQTRNVCKPVFDTVYETRNVTICRPVSETTMKCQPFQVCRPVTTTRQVTEFCLQPFTELVTVPVKTKCSRCGHTEGGCTCQTMARTRYKRVPVVREVTETRMVTEVQTRMVPVVHWRMVPEQRIEKVPVTVCRRVNEVIRFRVPKLVMKCEPTTVVYKQAVLTTEEIPVTVYRSVLKMVPVVQASSQIMPTSQGRETAPGLTGPSGEVPAPEKRDAEKGTPR